MISKIRKINEKKFSVVLVAVVLLVFTTLTALLLASPWRYVGKTGESAHQLGMALSSSPFMPYMDTWDEFSNFPPLFSWFIRAASVGVGNVEVAGRIVAFLSGIGTLLLTFKICASLYGKKTGYVAMLLLATSLLFLVLGTVPMSETTILFFSALSFFFLMKYSETGENKYLLLVGLFGFLAAFSKWTGIFTLAGAGAYLLYTKRVKILKNPYFYVAMILPPLLCLAWISSIPFKSPSYMAFGETVGEHAIFFLDKPLSQIFVDISYDMVVYVPLTTFCLALVGMIFSKNKNRLPHFWLLGGVLYYLLFLKGVGHHHYHYLMLPPLAIFGARGLILVSDKMGPWLKTKKHFVPPSLSILLLLVGSVEVGYAALYFHQKYGPYVEDMQLAVGYVNQNAGENGLIGFSNDWVYFFCDPSIDIARVRAIGPRGELIENLKETPKIIVLVVKNPDGKPSIEGEFLENEFGEVLNWISALDNYQLLKGDSYFRVIVKAG